MREVSGKIDCIASNFRRGQHPLNCLAQRRDPLLRIAERRTRRLVTLRMRAFDGGRSYSPATASGRAGCSACWAVVRSAGVRRNLRSLPSALPSAPSERPARPPAPGGSCSRDHRKGFATVAFRRSAASACSEDRLRLRKRRDPASYREDAGGRSTRAPIVADRLAARESLGNRDLSPARFAISGHPASTRGIVMLALSSVRIISGRRRPVAYRRA